MRLTELVTDKVFPNQPADKIGDRHSRVIKNLHSLFVCIFLFCFCLLRRAGRPYLRATGRKLFYVRCFHSRLPIYAPIFFRCVFPGPFRFVLGELEFSSG